MSERNRLHVRVLAAGVAVTAVALLATGCSTIQQLTSDAWSVTYEVQVDKPTGAKLTDVRVEGAEQRNDASEVHRLGSVDTSVAADGGSRWTHESVVITEQRASVSATPGKDAKATCRILLDGKREIASETSSAPGETVRCSVKTPKLD